MHFLNALREPKLSKAKGGNQEFNPGLPLHGSSPIDWAITLPHRACINKKLEPKAEALQCGA